MNPEYALQYRNLYARHWWWRAREEAILKVLRRRIAPKAGFRILDVGCGDGLFFDRLAEFGDVEGVESDAELVNPEGAHRGRILIAPFDTNFRPSECYSLVLMLDVLEHLDRPVEALRHAHSLLAPGGSFLLTVPAFPILWTNHDTINHHRVRYKCETLVPLLQQAGFTILEEKYWFQWIFPAKLAIRCMESIIRRPPSAARVPPAWINDLLYWISRTELSTLSAIELPFGSSLMVYCEKQGTH